jgi:hypothetical protein
VETNAANVVDICNTRYRILVRSPENSTKYFVLCKSANIMYILECSICGLQYVGESKQPFHKRLNGHRSDLTKKPFLHVNQHFGLSDHNLEDFNKMKILVIEQNCLWSYFQRENRERFWIKELRVLYPDGINRKQ